MPKSAGTSKARRSHGSRGTWPGSTSAPSSSRSPLGPEHRVKYESELWSLKYDGVENEPVQDFFDRVRELSNRIYWSGGASSEGDVKGAIERATGISTTSPAAAATRIISG